MADPATAHNARAVPVPRAVARTRPAPTDLRNGGAGAVSAEVASVAIMKDRRVRSVPWKDLLPLNRWDVTRELLIPLPWLAASLLFSHLATTVSWWFLVGTAASGFVFFLAGLRLAHGAQHYSIGLSRRWTDFVAFVLSVTMLSSMHAVQVTHLRHHADCLGASDVESASARRHVAFAFLLGWMFPLQIHYHGMRHGSRRQRRWIVVEVAAYVAWSIAVLAWWREPVLIVHVAAMALGECFTAFFAVWTVHHGCEPRHFIARTLRGRVKNFVTMSMFLHVEHHLYPRVPTSRLRTLAERLDAVAPELRGNVVF